MTDTETGGMRGAVKKGHYLKKIDTIVRSYREKGSYHWNNRSGRKLSI